MSAQQTVIARFLTLAAEITGDHTITVDITTDGGGWATARCTACPARHRADDLHMQTKTLPWAVDHAGTCRAVPLTR